MLFFKYLKEYRIRYGKLFWSGLGLLAITNALDVIPPLIIMKGIDQITARANAHELLKTALMFGALTIALAFVRFHWRMQWGRYHQNLSRDLRNQVFEKFMKLGPTFYNKNTTGELMSLLTNDVESVRMGMGPGILVITDALLYFVTIPPIMISISWGLTWKTLCLLPFLPVFVSWLGGIVDRRFETVQERFSELAGLATENISGIRLVKTYVQEENQAKIFNAKSNEWHQSSLKVAWPESFMHPVMEFCVSVGVAVLIIWGGDQVIKEAITVGTFFAFHRYISKMAWPMTAIGWGYSLISQARASLRRVDEFLNTPIDVNLIEETGEKKNLNGEITINHLNFNYPSTTQGALHDISLKIPQGTTLGIVGTVGAGKTTLVHLLSGLYKVERGTIVINGVDINDIPLQQLRQHIAVIPQDTFLFSRTVHENIGYGLESLPDLPAASQYARLVSFDREVIDLPNGWNTLLGDRGVNLSGGQKQRLTMARALIRQSSVVIFDDSLSSVDAETETNILRALQTELKGKTAIIVSHRLSAVSDCDQILVLHNGQKEALGTPQEVASSSLTLKELLALQGMGESW